MKKYTIPAPTFLAALNDGTPGGLIAAAEAYQPGSADSFDFKEHDGSVGFTDNTGTEQRAAKGDYLQPVLNSADNTFDGYQLITAGSTTEWVEVKESEEVA